MNLPFHPLRFPYHWFRPCIQTLCWAFFFVGPFLNWFRIDMIAGHLMFLGHPYPLEVRYLQWLPFVFYGGVLLIALTCTLLGRVFCGWACPHNTLSEWTRPFRLLLGQVENIPVWYSKWSRSLFKKQPRLKPLIQVTSLLLGVLLSTLLSLPLVSFVVSPQWILAQYTSGHPHVALVFGQGVMIFLGLFLLYTGHNFCRTCCPYGMAQSVSAYMVGKWRPMEVIFKGNQASDCGPCRACQTICPVAIDPRSPQNLKVGVSQGCFNCGECIDACNYVQPFKKHRGLLGFTLPGQSK